MAAKKTTSRNTPIYLVRHLKPQIEETLCYGQTDVSARIISPAEHTLLLKQLPSSAIIFSSPLTRCASLAHSLFPAGDINFTPLLMELNFGTWEMTRWDSIERALLDSWAENTLHFKPLQGESFNDLCQRVQRFVEHLEPSRPAVIITHAGIIKAFWYLFGGMELHTAIGQSIAFGSVTQLLV